MKFGIDRLLEEPQLRKPLAGRRVALLAHPASLTRNLVHSMDALATLGDIRLSAAFGPQHGLRGDKQYNMVESEDFIDPVHGIPVFSLYGEVRRPTQRMMDSFDVLLVDLQDVGCRIYTFVSTLRYVLEEAAKRRKTVWVLDRPNPIGRPVEGLSLRPGCESFVGPGPIPMRHGLTLGELARWFVSTLRLDVDCQVIALDGWEPEAAPGYGWPLGRRTWINPSPNAPNLWMARCYPGTVMVEGTTLSEGRGTTRPLEFFGAPDLDIPTLLATKLCAGVQINVEDAIYYEHEAFRPWRLMALAFKALRRLAPEYPLWRDFAYEYERDRLAIDVINGSDLLRRWADDPAASPADLETLAAKDEAAWSAERQAYLLY
jgi:uncharacterized protein YbbC (DUF1343 family)